MQLFIQAWFQRRFSEIPVEDSAWMNNYIGDKTKIYLVCNYLSMLQT